MSHRQIQWKASESKEETFVSEEVPQSHTQFALVVYISTSTTDVSHHRNSKSPTCQSVRTHGVRSVPSPRRRPDPVLLSPDVRGHYRHPHLSGRVVSFRDNLSDERTFVSGVVDPFLIASNYGSLCLSHLRSL